MIGTASSIVIPVLFLVSGAGKLHADVVVVGGTPAGIASAVAAARMGSNVALLEPTKHVGGIVSNGLTNADILKRQAVGGLFYEFTQRVLTYYRNEYGADSPQVKACKDGYYYEPHVAERIFLNMLVGEDEKIRVYYRHRLIRVVKKGCRVVEVVAEDLAHDGREVSFAGEVFVDATYEGDLAAWAGVACRVGRESRDEFGERHAGVIYARFGEDEHLPGSTGEADKGIQAYCFRLFMTRRSENRLPVEKPPSYDRDDYRHLLADIEHGRVKRVYEAIQFLPMPNDKREINSNHPSPTTGGPSESGDLAEENWAYPEASYLQREKIFQRYWNYQLGLVWFLQNEPEISEVFRREASTWGFCKDEFTDNHHHPRQMYVRETRRIVGQYVFTERDGDFDSELGRTRLRPTSIAVAEFPWDSHGVHKYDPKHPGVREGYFYIHHSPAQVPYGVLVPREVEGLLVPVCCSASHVGYQSLRVEPTYMALGHAAGIAAHLAASLNVSVRDVPTDRLQMDLVSQGGVITYYDDLAFDHPAFGAFQFLGARGLNSGYRAQTTLKMSRKWGWTKLRRILQAMEVPWKPPSDRPNELLSRGDVLEWLDQVGWVSKAQLRRAPSDEKLDLEGFAVQIYKTITNAHAGSQKRGRLDHPDSVQHR